MTVYTGNPFGGFGGFGGGMRNPRMPTPRPRPMPRPMNRPPMNQYQMPPMNQMPRRMPGGPSKGGTTSIPVRPSGGGAPWGGYNPNAGFPGGPGKARNRGQSRGGSWFGGGMPGGPGKGRQTMQPQPFFGNNPPPTAPPPTTGQMGPPSNLQFKMPEPWPIYGNNPPPQPDLTGSGEGGYGGGNIEGGYQQIPITRPGGSGFSGPAVPDFGQRRPINMPPMNFPQPTLRPDQTMGRPMPQPIQFSSGRPMSGTGQPTPLDPSTIRLSRGDGGTLPPFMGEVGQAFTQGPSSIPNSPFMRQQMGMRFYGGGITDLYPR